MRAPALQLGGFAAGVCVALGTACWVFGVAPLLIATLILCIVIIVVTAVGCSLHLREINLLEEAEERVHIQSLLAEQMQLIGELLENHRERLRGYETILDQNAGSGAIPAELRTAQCFVAALDDRFQHLLEASAVEDLEALRVGAELAEQPLALPPESPTAELAGESAPQPPEPLLIGPELWRAELESCFMRVELRYMQTSGRAA